ALRRHSDLRPATAQCAPGRRLRYGAPPRKVRPERQRSRRRWAGPWLHAPAGRLLAARRAGFRATSTMREAAPQQHRIGLPRSGLVQLHCRGGADGPCATRRPRGRDQLDLDALNKYYCSFLDTTSPDAAGASVAAVVSTATRASLVAQAG